MVEVIKPNSSINAMAVSSEPVIMDQVNKRFVPDLILIQQGQSIVFPNSDNIRHHVYSFSKAKTFELKLYAGEPKKPIKFETNGVVIVGCNIHDSMIGSIYVTKQTAMMTDDKGKVRLDFDPMIDKVSIWHPLQKNNPEERKIIDLKDYQLAESINNAQNVFEQYTKEKEKLLTTAARVLTADFVFKQAVTTKDAETIASVLLNHGQRIDADLMLLTDLEGQLISSSLLEFNLDSAQTTSLKVLLNEPGKTHFMILQNTLYQLLALSVNAPRPIAYAIVGFEINSVVADELKTLTGLDISFLMIWIA
jgi:plastocyanin